ncbi:MAG TPA: type II secretion system minor pseudopilin GspJ [Nevskiaceae bacterium]
MAIDGTRWCRPPAARRCPVDSAGFTLLELLVVIGIFAVFAAMAYGGLISVLQTRADLEARLDRTATYQKAYWILRDDFQSGVDRPVLGNDGQLQSALQYAPAHRNVEFTRDGWPNPMDRPRSTLRRVGYLWDEAHRALTRRTWPVLDRAPATGLTDTTLLGEVDAVHWRFLGDGAGWTDAWPSGSGQLPSFAIPGVAAPGPLANAQPPPRAVELVLETHDWGRVRLLFPYGRASGSSRNGGVSWLPQPEVAMPPHDPAFDHGDPLHPQTAPDLPSRALGAPPVTSP